VRSEEIGKILHKGLEKVKFDILANMASSKRNASGKTSKSLRVEVKVSDTQVKAVLYGSSVFEQLEFGRGKTKNGTKGSSSWFKELLAWVKIRGLPEGSVYAIFKKINKEGYKGTKGLVTNPVDSFKGSVAKDMKAIILKDFKDNGVNSNQ
jgi:hypothetical protein